MQHGGVSKTVITSVRHHPGADRLDIIVVDGLEVVTGRDRYIVGAEVVFVPENYILSALAAELAEAPYMAGKRVKAMNVRGVRSHGMLLPPTTPADILAGIFKYEPPIPQHLQGKLLSGLTEFSQHDVESFNKYAAEFVPGELVIVTEKIHGSQISVIGTAEGLRVASKGVLSRGCTLAEDPANAYWRAVRNMPLEWQDVPDGFQLFGEMVPCQKGFLYGKSKNRPEVLLYEVRYRGVSVPRDELFVDRPSWAQSWVPCLYIGPLDADMIRSLAGGMEAVSGCASHIREGIVVRPAVDRRAYKGFRLQLKILNPAYWDSGEAVA